MFATAAALCAAVIGIGAAVLAVAGDRADRAAGRLDLFGRDHRARPQLAALGDCAVCHTAADGMPNAGGRAMQTPFGTIYATNITPDVETGIGAGPSRLRARDARGHSRDGHHLYPAFPYTPSPRPATTTCRRSTPT